MQFDEKTISRIWQYAHWQHYFGHDRTTPSMNQIAPKSLIADKEAAPCVDTPIEQPPAVSKVGSEVHGGVS